MGTGKSAIEMLRVLAVDDHPVNRAFLRAALAPAVAHLVVASSGPEAIEASRAERFDLVLLDLHMPDVDGFSTWAALRQGDEPPLAVALTADPRNEARQRARAEGFRGYLEKPTPPNVLIDALHRITRGERLFRPPGLDAGSGPLLDDDQGLSALGSADRLNQLRAAFFRELSDGLPDLDRDLDAGDWEAARNRLHQWIGASGYIGASRLTTASKRLHESVCGPARDRAGIHYLQFRRCAEATLLAMAPTG